MPFSPRRLVALVFATAVLAVSVHATPDRVVGSVHSDIYHRPDCANARRIHTENLREWPTPEAARADDYRPGQRCFPEATAEAP